MRFGKGQVANHNIAFVEKESNVTKCSFLYYFPIILFFSFVSGVVAPFCYTKAHKRLETPDIVTTAVYYSYFASFW